MKRQSNLWSRVWDFKNLHCATYKVMRGKRQNSEMAEFFRGLESNLFQLQRELVECRYQPGGYRTFWIQEPKERLISAASIRDRIVHHALIQVIEPVFEKRFIYHSYACRKDKGTHKALIQFNRWLHSSRYVLKMDIRKFFPSIDHALLNQRLARFIKDEGILQLSNRIIARSNPQEAVVGYFPGDSLFTPHYRRRGLPIGNLTSQFFANVYLDSLDHFVKEQLGVKRYLRYVDDFCCFADSKAELHQIREEISAYLMSLRLRLNEKKSRIRRLKEGVEFLGFVHSHRGIRLNQTAVRRQRARMKALERRHQDGRIGLPEVFMSIQAWCAHIGHGNCEGLRRDVLQALGQAGVSPALPAADDYSQ